MDSLGLLDASSLWDKEDKTSTNKVVQQRCINACNSIIDPLSHDTKDNHFIRKVKKTSNF